jgi:hypothetical protein
MRQKHNLVSYEQDAVQQHRLRVENQFGEAVHSMTVPAGTDPGTAMDQEAVRWASEGWIIERDSTKLFRYPSFFMSRDGDRWFVALYPVRSHGN